MNNQEAKIKMAEMCGYEVNISGGQIQIALEMNIGGYPCFNIWNPQENLEQAMEVLRVLRSKGVCYCMSNESSTVGVTLFEGDFIDEDTVICNGSAGINGESEAIFQAVKKYLENQQEREG
jgi:hypothetical protein